MNTSVHYQLVALHDLLVSCSGWFIECESEHRTASYSGANCSFGTHPRMLIDYRNSYTRDERKYRNVSCSGYHRGSICISRSGR